MRMFLLLVRARITRQWLIAYGSYLLFVGLCWFPDRYLIWPHSHAGFYVAWGVICLAGVWLHNRTEKSLNRRR